MAVSWLTFTDEIGRRVKVVGGPGVDGMSDDFLDVETTVMYWSFPILEIKYQSWSVIGRATLVE